MSVPAFDTELKSNEPNLALISVPENTSELLVATVNPVNNPSLSSNPKKPTLADDPSWYLNSIPLSLLSSEPGAVSPPKVNIGSSTVVVVELTVVVVPFTVKSPVTVKLSLIVVSDVVWPILTGTPDVAVPIVIPLLVLELSMFNVDVLSNDMLEPSTTKVPSISVLSKLAVPSMSASPDMSSVAASNSPDKVMLVAPVTAPF